MPEIDFIATKYGLKSLMRTDCKNQEEFGKISQLCRKNGLFAFQGNFRVEDKKTGSKIFFVYISKNQKIAKNFSEEDPEYSENKFKLKYFAKILGYPKCCIDAHFELEFGNLSENEKKEILFKKIQEEKKPFLLNNFLYALGYGLSFYQPCSYHCQKAIKYNKKILEAVEKEDPNYANEIKKYLRFPLVVWFDAKSNINDFFYNRIQLLFKGCLNDFNLSYNEVILYRNYPRCNQSFSEEELKDFFQGNRCQVFNDEIKIFNKNKIIKEMEITNKYHGVLIKFN